MISRVPFSRSHTCEVGITDKCICLKPTLLSDSNSSSEHSERGRFASVVNLGVRCMERGMIAVDCKRIILITNYFDILSLFLSFIMFIYVPM